MAASIPDLHVIAEKLNEILIEKLETAEDGTHFEELCEAQALPTELNLWNQTFGLRWGIEDVGVYCIVGMNVADLPDISICAEIEYGTYGSLQGWRFYFDALAY